MLPRHSRLDDHVWPTSKQHGISCRSSCSQARLVKGTLCMHTHWVTFPLYLTWTHLVPSPFVTSHTIPVCPTCFLSYASFQHCIFFIPQDTFFHCHPRLSSLPTAQLQLHPVSYSFTVHIPLILMHIPSPLLVPPTQSSSLSPRQQQITSAKSSNIDLNRPLYL